MRFLTLFLSLFFLNQAFSQSEITFSSFDALKQFVFKNSPVLKRENSNLELASLTQKAAVGNVLNPRAPVSGTLTNNTQLPVNFIPAEIFGGPAGTFREVQFGQQFISVLNISPQFDIINPSKIGDVKSAKINKELAEMDNKLFIQNFESQLSFLYYNITGLQEQSDVVSEQLIASEGILDIVHQKYVQGLLSIVELNDAELNVEDLKRTSKTIQLNIESQLAFLKSTAGIEENIVINDHVEVDEFISGVNVEVNSIYLKKFILNEAFVKQSFKSSKLQNLPTLSFFSSFNWQNNSNSNYFDSNQRWINSNFYGLKLTYDIPSTVGKLTNMGTLRIQRDQAELMSQISKVQAESDRQTLNNDYLKALADYQVAEKSVRLLDESYQVQLDRFNQEILPLEKLLEMQRKLLVAKTSLASSMATLQYQLEKIRINNLN
ncbi:MAG: TolC family protein [Flavobacteriales bacterium]